MRISVVPVEPSSGFTFQSETGKRILLRLLWGDQLRGTNRRGGRGPSALVLAVAMAI